MYDRQLDRPCSRDAGHGREAHGARQGDEAEPEAPVSQPTTPVRAAEFMACLSVAADLGMGQPADYALTTCVLAMRLGDALGFDTATLHDVYYETLLRYVGCNADVQWFASLFGDELAFRAEYAALDTAD